VVICFTFEIFDFVRNKNFCEKKKKIALWKQKKTFKKMSTNYLERVRKKKELCNLFTCFVLCFVEFMFRPKEGELRLASLQRKKKPNSLNSFFFLVAHFKILTGVMGGCFAAPKKMSLEEQLLSGKLYCFFCSFSDAKLKKISRVSN
jgi:hypothetical protein